jgi:hypothetical protein
VVVVVEGITMLRLLVVLMVPYSPVKTVRRTQVVVVAARVHSGPPVQVVRES